jgi:hypothetical protein
MQNGWRLMLVCALLGFAGSSVIWVVAVVRGVF